MGVLFVFVVCVHISFCVCVGYVSTENTYRRGNQNIGAWKYVELNQPGSSQLVHLTLKYSPYVYIHEYMFTLIYWGKPDEPHASGKNGMSIIFVKMYVEIKIGVS